MPGFGAKKFDLAINDIAMTPERKKAYRFSDPYIYSKSALIMKKDDQAIKQVGDIKGQKIAGSATGTANADNVKKIWWSKRLFDGDFATAMSLVRGRTGGRSHEFEGSLFVLPKRQPALRI